MSGERNANGEGERRAALPVAAAAVGAIALAIYWTHGIPRTPGLGWDESTNAALPAARILLALKAGDLRGAFDVLLGCSQYPFVYPTFLAAVEAVFGFGEATCRAAATVVWCAAILGVFLLAREVEDDGIGPFFAAAFAALSPMALAFAGTLFLEVPFACASIFALRAWLRRRRRPRIASEVAAGAWVAVCLFTKWNYGLLLGAGLAVDWTLDAILAFRAGERRAFLSRSAALALVPALLCLWWFVLPMPGSLDVAAGHRRDLAAFLAGNQDFVRVPFFDRMLDAFSWLELTPRLLALIGLAALCTLPSITRPALRTVWLVLAGFAIPAFAHPFHQDRFLIPIVVPLWVLGGVGLARILPDSLPLRAGILAALIPLAILYPGRGALRTAGFFDELSENPKIRAYQEEMYTRRVTLAPSRPLPTAGLPREELDTILGVVEREADPEERIGWFGVSSKLSPGALRLGLLERGGSVARFLRDAGRPMDVAYFGDDPGWSDEELRTFASGFDVVFSTEPPDLTLRGARNWTRTYRQRLVASLGWSMRVIGSLRIARPANDAFEVSILACRPSR